jgi:hypothetical protein
MTTTPLKLICIGKGLPNSIRLTGRSVNCELQEMWPNMKHFAAFAWQGRKSHGNYSQAKIWARDIPNTKQLDNIWLYMKNDIFWDVTPCGSCKNLTRATRYHIPEDDIFHSHHRENLKSYIALTGRTL